MIGAILLAAGSSRRFGGDKRRALLPSGGILIRHSLDMVLNAFDEVLLVLRYGDHLFEQEILNLTDDPRLRTFRAPESALGMGHSLASAIHETGLWHGAFIFLADMPYIRADTIAYLKKRLTDKPQIILPTKDGRYGHPVGFHSAYFDEIGRLKGDRGAKEVITAHPADLVEVPVEDPGILQDVDRPPDL